MPSARYLTYTSIAECTASDCGLVLQADVAEPQVGLVPDQPGSARSGGRPIAHRAPAFRWRMR
jgi:hypothetical protein